MEYCAVIFTNEPYLSHHGILGQKWGVRRWQNEDGSLTSAGRDHYGVGDVQTTFRSSLNRKKAERIQQKIDVLKKQKADPKTIRDLEKERNFRNSYAQKLEDDRDYKNFKSKHFNKIYDKYVESGMSHEEAMAAATKRVRTEKILIATAAVTVAACAAAYAYNKYSVDTVISKDTNFQRIIHMAPNDAMKDGAAYFSFGNHDNAKYEGLYGFASFGNDDVANGNHKVYKMAVNFKQDLKVASPKNAKNKFMELYRSDASFRNVVNKTVSSDAFALGSPGQKSIMEKAKYAVKSGHVDGMKSKDLYEAFNVAIPLMKQENSNELDKFYDHMKKAGYNAIKDVNDMKYSGYKSKSPLIVFSGGYDWSRTELDVQDTMQKMYTEYGKQAIRDFTKTAGVVAAGKLAYDRIVGDRIDGGTITKAERNQIKSLSNSGMTVKEIALKLGISESSVKKYA